MSVVMDRRHPSRLRWYRGSSAAAAAALALRDPGRPGCWVLRGGIELDAARMPRFRALLDRSVRSGARVVVLDLRDTEFLSLRVAVLLGVAKADAWARGVDIRLLTASREVERALGLVGVRPLFRYYRSIDEASGSESGC
ncbi:MULTISPECIES: STAS domain-containing protein [Nocardia]|uniref:STAS domain-containing protein n=1 Tax=Nocardia TaxID=1817 RepID=UPI0026592029|nr:STAS domain-containing protein [Nocardia sp. PE-7]WKG11617.1 STAS domain-containing protein [Nocardia sp. PE-7]